jgi:hypothetical protein
MKLANPRIQSLREMLGLEERRSKLQSELDALEERIAGLKGAIFSGNQAAGAIRPSNQRVPSGAKATRKRTPRGLLKNKIMSALEAAGSAGVRVKDLAAALGTKAVNVHSWFHSNVKRNPSIKKISGGHYSVSVNGSSKASTAKSKQSGKSKAPAKHGKRGAFSAKILGQLKAAGPGGITVRDLADKLGAKYKNVYIWFATTGKKNRGVKKLGPAHYKLTS